MENERVISVYDGKVIAVIHNKALKNAVIIRHGDFFTVYSGLERTNLKKGTFVAKNQEIGNLSRMNDANFHFEVWKGEKKLDSENWVTCQN